MANDHLPSEKLDKRRRFEIAERAQTALAAYLVTQGATVTDAYHKAYKALLAARDSIHGKEKA